MCAKKVEVKTGEIVLSAIKKLTRNTGWTVRTITKFIRLEYKLNDPKVNRKISRALKRGVKLGLLECAHHRYKLSDKMKLCRSLVSVARSGGSGRHKRSRRRCATGDCRKRNNVYIRSRTPSKSRK